MQEALLLGVLQGLTEFLPISSTGHLLLAEWLLELSPERFGLPFDAALHLGTLLGILGFFWRDYGQMAASGLRRIFGRSGGDPAALRQLTALLVATVPAVVAGLLLADAISTTLRSPFVVAVTLALFGALLLWVERVSRGQRSATELIWQEVLLIGCAQAVALVPGVSRSGATIAAGMLLGLRRESAARFAFLLSGPIVAGAGGLQLLHLLLEGQSAQLGELAIGMASAAITGYLVIRFLLRFLANHGLDIFAYYRFLLALAVLSLLLMRGG